MTARCSGQFRSRRLRVHDFGPALGVVIALVAVLPSQAMGAGATSAKVPSICVTPASAPIQRQAHQQPTLPPKDFCDSFIFLLAKANTRYARHYSSAKQRRIRRVIASVTPRTTPISTPSRAPAIRPVLLEFDLDDIKDVAKKSLKKVRSVVGGASKLIPQTRLLRCGLFAGLATAQNLIKQAQLRDVLIDAVFACIGASLPEARKK